MQTVRDGDRVQGPGRPELSIVPGEYLVLVGIVRTVPCRDPVSRPCAGGETFGCRPDVGRGTPIQVLWVNLIMDGPPALALGADPTRPEVMDRPPRDPDASILDNGRLRRLVPAGAVMAAGTIGVFAWTLDANPDDGGALAGTMAFTTFVLFQFVNAVDARLEHTTGFDRHTLRNGKLWLALAGVLALQIIAVHVPAIGGLVDVVPLSGEQWLAAAGIASTLLLVEELRKALTRARMSRESFR